MPAPVTPFLPLQLVRAVVVAVAAEATRVIILVSMLVLHLVVVLHIGLEVVVAQVELPTIVDRRLVPAVPLEGDRHRSHRHSVGLVTAPLPPTRARSASETILLICRPQYLAARRPRS